MTYRKCIQRGENPGSRTAYGRRNATKIEYDRSWQASPPQSDEIQRKVDDPMNAEDEIAESACTVTETKLANIMTQREMKILTTLFPKAAQTLAGVLCNRSDGF